MSGMLRQQLTEIITCYEEILNNGNTIYAHLKNRELEKIQQLQGQQFKAIQKLENLQSEFEKNVTQLCSQFNITEPRVWNLIPYLAKEEQAGIRQLHQQIINLDKETRIICERNGEFLKILLDLSENIVGWLSEYNEEHNHESQIFVDETL